MLIIASTTVRGLRTRGVQNAHRSSNVRDALTLQREKLLDAGTMMKVVLGDLTEYRKCLPLPPQTLLTTSYAGSPVAGVCEAMMSLAAGRRKRFVG